MPRRGREVTADGFVQCAKCKTWKHILEFYPVRRGSIWVTLQDPETGEDLVYGKPMSRCIACLKAGRDNASETAPTILPAKSLWNTYSPEDLGVMPRTPVPEHEDPQTP